MKNNDSIFLLKECDAGTKMGISSIDDVLDNVRSGKMESLLNESRDHHDKLEQEIHRLLIEYGSKEKEPAPMAKGMAKMKTNMKIAMHDTDSTIADLMIDGCNMGVKSLYKYMNQYPNADEKVKDICLRLIGIEEELNQKLRPFL